MLHKKNKTGGFGMRFKDKVAIVAGGGGGIGAAVAAALGAEGAKVVVWDLNEEGAKETAKKIEANKGKAKAAKMDVLNYDQVKAGVAEVVKEFGQLDIMVCSVGGGKMKPFKAFDSNYWKQQVSYNLDSVFNCANAAVGPMLSRKYGKMFFFTSATGGIANLAGYEVGKAGLESLVKTIAAETQQHRLNINAMNPGFTDTPLTRSVFPPGEAGEKMWAERAASTPGGINTPEKVAKVVLFFLSEDADRLTGQIVTSY
jgi:3-oxoacyl-[acyl-carrier protein] reductase